MIELVTSFVLNDWKTSKTIYLIDVREQEEFDSGHLQGAILQPLSEFDPRSIQKPEGPLVFYCRSGARSEYAAHLVKNLHPDWDIYNLQGGILEWKKQGFDIE